LPAAAASAPATPPPATTLAPFGLTLASSFRRRAGWFLRRICNFMHSRRRRLVARRLRCPWRLTTSYWFNLANLLRLRVESQLCRQFFPMIVFAHVFLIPGDC
jgi:hypothetical protein